MILDRFKLTDKIAIVTGAGRGIGRGIALGFAEVGAHVVCAARSVPQIEETAAEIRARGRRALPVQCDVMQREQLEQLVARTLAEFGRIDLLVNNAGGWPPKDALRTSEKAFEEAFRFNVTSAFVLTRLVVPHMVEDGRRRHREHLVAGRQPDPAGLRRLRHVQGGAVVLEPDARARSSRPRCASTRSRSAPSTRRRSKWS